MPQILCKTCLKDFHAKPSWILKGVGKYCSRTCQIEGRKTGTVIVCSLCNKEVYKQRKAIENSKSGKLFCSLYCSNKWHNAEYVGPDHKNWNGGEFSYKRVLERSGKKLRCRLCDKDDRRFLVAHHIDWNRKNNMLSNLTWLCLNCHHLVHNYSEAKNKLDAIT